jgi:hypothetical protein
VAIDEHKKNSTSENVNLVEDVNVNEFFNNNVNEDNNKN